MHIHSTATALINNNINVKIQVFCLNNAMLTCKQHWVNYSILHKMNKSINTHMAWSYYCYSLMSAQMRRCCLRFARMSPFWAFSSVELEWMCSDATQPAGSIRGTDERDWFPPPSLWRRDEFNMRIQSKAFNYKSCWPKYCYPNGLRAMSFFKSICCSAKLNHSQTFSGMDLDLLHNIIA